MYRRQCMYFGMYIHGLFSHQDASSSDDLPVKMPHLLAGV